MQYKLLASDFDNTLVPFGEPCPRPAVVKAVKKMQAAGGKFVLSTGRGYCVINKQQLGGIRFNYAITNNGACVVDRDGAIIAEHPMTNEEMYALVDFCEDYNYPLQFNFRDGYYAYCEYESLRDFYAQLSGSGLTCRDGEDQDRHLIDMPHAAFACLPDEALEAFNRKYGHLNLRFMMVGAVREGNWHCYDIVREGIDKGVGLADLCETVGLTLADAVSAGDSANDVGMLKAAGLGCCMANGSDDAKEAADRIIGDVREDGLAALIEELWFNGPRAEPSAMNLAPPGARWKPRRKSSELCTGLQRAQPSADPGHLAQPQEPGNVLLLRPPAKPLLAHAGGPDRGACACPGGHRSEKADHPAPRAGPVGYAGKLYHYRRVGCVHPGCGAQ